MKSHTVRRRRLTSCGRLLFILLCALFLFYLLTFTPSKSHWTPDYPQCVQKPPGRCQASDSFNVKCDRAKNASKEARRLLAERVRPRFELSPAKEFAPSELSGSPVIEGGLYTDRQDLDKPHEGENYVTFAEYLDCLAARLRVDYRNKEEYTLSKDEIQMSFPHMVAMGTVELPHIKTLMCNMSVPIRRLVYVVNSDVTAVTNFFHDVEKAFGFTKRLRVHWSGYNMGYPGSVNIGMRDALRYSFDEVPFFFIMNNDVRFFGDTLPVSLRKFREITKKDKTVLEGLRQEVANEPSIYTPPDRCNPLLRSSDNSTLLVTSTSLPDRIRYVPYEQRREIFKHHYGALFFDNLGDAAAFGMSRLAIETVGFMDENFYPAYYEDTDWRFRQLGLGFPDFYMSGVPAKKHFEHVLHRLASQYDSRPDSATEAEIFAKGSFHIIHSVFNENTIVKKFGPVFRRVFDLRPNCLVLPIDAWVMDVPRRKILMEAFAASHKFFKEGGPAQGKESTLLLGWLPQSERERILGGFPGEPMGDVVKRAFKDCKLVRHAEE